MLTGDTLRQYQDLTCEIEELKERLDKLANPTIEHDAVTGSMTEIPYKMHTIHIFGVQINKYTAKRRRLEQMLKNCIDKYQDLTLEVTEGILAIEDSRTRRVLSMRYIDRMSWTAISEALGSHERSYARKIAEKYIKNL